MVANLTLHDAVNNYDQYELGQFRDKYFNNMDLICYYGGIDFESIELWKNEIFKIYSIDPDDVSCVETVGNNTREITLITCTNGHKNRLVTKAREVL